MEFLLITGNVWFYNTNKIHFNGTLWCTYKAIAITNNWDKQPEEKNTNFEPQWVVVYFCEVVLYVGAAF